MKGLIKPSVTLYFLLILVAPTILVSTAIYFKFSRDLPKANQSNSLQFNQHHLSVFRDEFSIPEIQGQDELAVYYGLGVMHAQDRLWQMEVNRRRAAGTLSAVMGASTLSSDRLMRTLGLKQNAEYMWKELPEDQKQILNAYTRGINQAVADLSTLPIEFSLFDFSPKVWTPVDSMLLMQLMTWDLASNMESEITRSLLVKNFGLEKANELVKPINMANSDSFSAAIDESLLGPHFFNRDATGSNGWVIAGQHTVSGKPILANDLHLPNSIPSIWYLARLKGGNLEVTGATFPGLPFVVIGRNKHIAWGITNMMADTQDIYFERINPNNRNQYFFDGNWHDMQLSQEIIEVKAGMFKPQGEPVTLQVRRTRNGALLSDLDKRLDGVSFSLKWTADHQNGGTFSSFNRLNYAKNWQEFKMSLHDYVAPVQSFLYADNTGNIGYFVPGKMPKRKLEDGMLPKNGWQVTNQWDDWIPFNALPQQLNPAQGYVIAANNHFIEDDYPYFLTGDWSDDFRAKAIQSKLQHSLQSFKSGIDIQFIKNLQKDVLSPDALQNLTLLLQSLDPEHQNAELLTLLSEWDGNMSRESVAATVYTAWLYQINRLMLADELDSASIAENEKQYLSHLTRKMDLALVSNTLTKQSSHWCDFVMSEELETCDVIVNSAFEHAINKLNAQYGNNHENWLWGEVHQAQFPHFPFSQPEKSASGISYFNGILSSLFHRELGASGGEQTINVSPSSFREESWFMQFYGTSYRQIVDFGDHNNDVFSNTTGQSGNVFSQHYDDMLIGHHRVEYIPMSATTEIQNHSID